MKQFSIYLVVVLVSVAATFGTYKYMERAKPYSVADTYNYGGEFEQKNVQLASFTSEGYPDFTKAAENSVHAVVHIKSTTKAQTGPSRGQRAPMDPFEYFFGFGDRGREYSQPQPRVGSGSGVLISKEGYIITNNHVIDKATEIEVTLNDDRKLNAKLIGTDPNTDIALIKIEGGDFPYIPFGDSDKIKVGEWVLAVGNPFNLTSTVTAGIVSAKARAGIGGGKNTIQSFIQTDAAINPGNSGGALVNTDGQLIGINTAIYSQTGSFAGYGFAVPISIAGKVVADIKEYGAVQRAQLGISILNLSDAKAQEYDKDLKEKASKSKRNNGVYVADFAEQSPAKQAGIDVGDIIISVNGVNTPTTGVLQEQISRFRPGDKIKVEVDRNGSVKAFDIILKNTDGNTSIVKKEDGLAIVGAAFKQLTPEQKKSLGIKYGVEVAGTDKGGKFQAKGITKGFIIQEVNNQPVDSPDDIEAIISAVGASKDKVLFIKGITATGKRKYDVVELTD